MYYKKFHNIARLLFTFFDKISVTLSHKKNLQLWSWLTKWCQMRHWLFSLWHCHFQERSTCKSVWLHSSAYLHESLIKIKVLISFAWLDITLGSSRQTGGCHGHILYTLVTCYTIFLNFGWVRTDLAIFLDLFVVYLSLGMSGIWW